MKTKEEILEKHYRNYKNRIANEENVLLAMEEYADQFNWSKRKELIDFYMWLLENGKIKYNGKPHKYNQIDEYLDQIKT